MHDLLIALIASAMILSPCAMALFPVRRKRQEFRISLRGGRVEG